MSATDKEPRKIGRGAIGKSWITVTLLIVGGFSGLYVFMLLWVVPKFQQIYIDALPGMPMPPLTKVVLNYRTELAVAALVWPAVGVFLCRRQNRFASLWINSGILIFVVAIALTCYALIIPMVGTNVGMSDAGK